MDDPTARRSPTAPNLLDEAAPVAALDTADAADDGFANVYTWASPPPGDEEWDARLRESIRPLLESLERLRERGLLD